MKRLEKALRAELEAGGGALAPTLAEQALLLARRLDADPPDRDAAVLSRELRLVLAELRHLAGGQGGELEAFLAGISASSLGGRG